MYVVMSLLLFNKNRPGGFPQSRQWAFPSLLKWLYRLTRLPFTPFVGPLPMPLTSVLGAPLAPVGDVSTEAFARQVRDALQALMRAQLAPPSA